MNRFAIFLILIALTGLAACEREIESKDPVRSLPADCPRVINLTPSLGDQSASLTWEASNTTDIRRFRIYVATATDTAYTLWDSVAAYSYTFSRLTPNRTYAVAVAPVLTSGLECDRSDPTTVIISPLSMVINNNDRFTNSRDVTIQLNIPTSVTDIRLYEALDSATAIWKAMSGTQTSFRLSDGDGIKTVYAELLFADGGRTATPLSDQITLDRIAEITSVSFTPTDSLFRSGNTITFSLIAGESDGTASVSFGSLSRLDLYETTTPGVYQRSWIVPVGFSLASGTVTGTFTDAAGNRAVNQSAPQVLRIAGDLNPVTLTATALSSYEVALSWTQTTSEQFLSYRIYRDTLASVSSASTMVAAVSNRSTTSFIDEDLDENQVYYYRLYLYDTFGQVASSEIASVTTLANAPPDPIELYAIPDEDAGRLSLTWQRSNAVDFASYRVYRSNSSTVTTQSKLIAIITSASTTSGTYDAPKGTTYWRIFVFDKQGAATGSNTISVNIP